MTPNKFWKTTHYVSGVARIQKELFPSSASLKGQQDEKEFIVNCAVSADPTIFKQHSALT
jgi:hypothetical protein